MKSHDVVRSNSGMTNFSKDKTWSLKMYVKDQISRRENSKCTNTVLLHICYANNIHTPLILKFKYIKVGNEKLITKPEVSQKLTFSKTK